MRTWAINLVISAFALVVVPIVFLALDGAFSGSSNQYASPFARPAGDPFAGIPQGYRPQFGFGPPVQRPAITEDMQRQKCVSDLAPHAEIETDYREPYCTCLAKSSFYTSGSRSRSVIASCRTSVLADLSKRNDLKSVFEANFSRICDASFLGGAERVVDAEKVQGACGCMRSIIEASAVRTAAIGFSGSDSGGGNGIGMELGACLAQTQAFMGRGWQIEKRGDADVAVLQTLGSYDTSAMTFSCTPDNAMRLDVAYRPRGRQAGQIGIDPSSYTKGWTIHLRSGSAVGKEVSDFYQFIIDEQEKSVGSGNPSGFIEQMPDGRGDVYEARFGDVKKTVAPVLQACAPKPGGNFNAPAVTGAQALPGTAPDKWTYAGRTASFGLDAPADGVAPLTLLRFSCEGEAPFLELAGSFTDDEKTRDRLKVSLGHATALTFKMACDYDEGAVVCTAGVKADQLRQMAAAPAIEFSVGGKSLATVPFGAADAVRKTFPYCKLKQSGARATTAPTVASPAMPVGGAYTLTSSLNLRAAAADDGRLIRSLPAGTTLTIARKAASSNGEAWSAIALSGAEAGYVKDAALQRNIKPRAGAAADTNANSAPGADCTARLKIARDRFLSAVHESKIPSLVDSVICAHGKEVRRTASTFGAELAACPQSDQNGNKRKVVRKISDAAAMLTKSCR